MGSWKIIQAKTYGRKNRYGVILDKFQGRTKENDRRKD